MLYYYELPDKIRFALINKDTCYTSIDKELKPYIDGWNLNILEYSIGKVKELNI
tara:strand:- start:7704 stop:7865 length:162 start_codon:yes stop_codon:yes gene_type:complete